MINVVVFFKSIFLDPLLLFPQSLCLWFVWLSFLHSINTKPIWKTHIFPFYTTSIEFCMQAFLTVSSSSSSSPFALVPAVVVVIFFTFQHAHQKMNPIRNHNENDFRPVSMFFFSFLFVDLFPISCDEPDCETMSERTIIWIFHSNNWENFRFSATDQICNLDECWRKKRWHYHNTRSTWYRKKQIKYMQTPKKKPKS